MLLSYADRSRVIDRERVRRVAVRQNQSVSTFLVDGFVAGSWAVEREGSGAILRIRPLGPIPESDRAALLAEGAGLLDFLAADAATRDVILGPAWP